MSFYDKLVPIDFEYNHSKDREMNVVSVAYEVRGIKHNVWFNGDIHSMQRFRGHIRSLVQKKYTFIAHNWVAEGRAFLSLGIDPLKMRCICTFAEYRMLTNHNDKLMFGKQLIKGKEVVTHRRVYGEEPSVRTSKPEHSLASATYKLLGIKIDTDEKNEVRDIIIRADHNEVEASKDRILQYGESDITNLVRLYKAQIKEYKELLYKDFNSKRLIREQLLRGESMVRTAMIERVGYPINLEAVKNFALHTDDILGEIAADCNRQFPEVMPFTYDRGLNRYKQNTKNIRKWILESEYKKSWARTKTGISLRREEWEKRFKDGHKFKDGCFGSQMYRYYYTKQHLNGFQSTKGKSRTFWDSVGSDGRVRPWLSPYRSQSARFQPTSTDFIPLKASWMRSLIQPSVGRAIAAIDYGSEEFLISALVSGDDKMVEAYKSGDVYLAFAKEAHMVPQDATKHSHPNDRQIAKAVVLGISYGLTKVGLARDLKCSEEEAQEYIDTFNDIYCIFYKWKVKLIGEKKFEKGMYYVTAGSYESRKVVELPCGWLMWGNNDNERSVANMPIQGFGSSILRKAIQLCQDAGLEVIFPLHDALYVEFDQDDWVTVLPKFKQCMIDAFVFYFDDKESANLIRTDFEVWGFPNEVELSFDGEFVHAETIHIDERSVEQYDQFSKYFEADQDASDL